MSDGKRILVVGAGAIGGVIGALLKKEGQEVVFLTHREQTAERIRAQGMSVRGVRGSFSAPAEAHGRPQDLEGPFPLVLVAVKAYDLEAALCPLLPLIPPTGLVVSMQNGICIEALESLVGPERAAACVVGWGATMLGEAEVELTSEGELVIGSRSPRALPGVEASRKVLEIAFPTMVSPDIYASLYSKLIINSCITTLGAISGMTLGRMLARALYRGLFIDIIRDWRLRTP